MNFDKLRHLWDGHAKAVYAYLLHLTHSEADAKDFLQDVFCRLAREPELLERLSAEPRGYLLRQARNAVIDQARRREVRERVFAKINALRHGEAADAEDPDNPLLQRALAEALRKLPEEQRAVVHARLWKKQTLEEFAAAANVSINTAASRYRYGLDKMREHLRSLYEDLVPNPLPRLDDAMKKRSPIPFHASPEEPIIQPLEQRRVPSATGAIFALPVLPAPDDYADAHLADDVAHDVPVEVSDPAGHDSIDETIIPLDPVDTLPMSIDDVIKALDSGAGNVATDPIPEGDPSSEIDLAWVVSEVFDGSDPQALHVMDFTALPVNSATEHTTEIGTPDHHVELHPHDGTAIVPNTSTTAADNTHTAGADITLTGQVNAASANFVSGNSASGAVTLSLGSQSTVPTSDHPTGDHSGGNGATTPDTTTTDPGHQVPTGTTDTPTDHTPAPVHHEAVHHDAPATTATAGAEAPSPLVFATSEHAQSTDFTIDPHHDASAHFAPIVDLHAPSADAHGLETHAAAEHEVVMLDLPSAHHDLDLHAAGHAADQSSVEFHTNSGAGDTVDHWAPIEHFSSDHFATLGQVRGESSAAENDHGDPLPVGHSFADAGAMADSPHATLRGGSALTASTGAVFLASEAKIRDKKKQP